MRKFREREETGQKTGLVYGHAPCQLTPLDSPLELCEQLAQGSSSGARNLNQRVGES